MKIRKNSKEVGEEKERKKVTDTRCPEPIGFVTKQGAVGKPELNIFSPWLSLKKNIKPSFSASNNLNLEVPVSKNVKDTGVTLHGRHIANGDNFTVLATKYLKWRSLMATRPIIDLSFNFLSVP